MVPSTVKLINRLHERCLRIVYNDNKPSFQELLDKDKGVTIHAKNVRALPIEMLLNEEGVK